MTFGARDLAVGAGAAYALHTGGSARPWLLAAAFTDAVDAVATFAARRSLPVAGRARHGRARARVERGRLGCLDRVADARAAQPAP